MDFFSGRSIRVIEYILINVNYVNYFHSTFSLDLSLLK